MKYDLYVVGDSTPIATNIQSGYQYNPGDLVVRDYYIQSYNENGDTLDSNIDPGHAGVQPLYSFEMLITSPTKPKFATVGGGTITTTDNLDGTWTLSSNDAITTVSSCSMNITEVVVVSADSLTNINKAWRMCQYLTSFDATRLNSVVTAQSAWQGCRSLTSFDTSGLTNLTDARGTWQGCLGLTSFDVSPLVSLTSTWQTWYGCTGLTSFDASTMTLVTDIYRAWYSCSGLTTFDASGLTSATDARETWQDCTNLICFNELDSTGFSNKHFMLAGCSSLTAPTPAEQTQLISTTGFKYVNQNPCPAP